MSQTNDTAEIRTRARLFHETKEDLTFFLPLVAAPPPAGAYWPREQPPELTMHPHMTLSSRLDAPEKPGITRNVPLPRRVFFALRLYQ